MTWKKITEAHYKYYERVNERKLKTQEHKSRDGYFLWVRSIDGKPFLKIEVIYENVEEPTKYWIWKENSPT